VISFLAYFERSCVAIAFVLSAVWKMHHNGEFRLVLSALLPLRADRFRRLYAILGLLVPLVEFAIAAVLVFPHGTGRIGAIAAGLLVVVLGSTLLRRDLSEGCGCWSAPRVNRGALITRNVILLALALTSVPADAGPAWPVAVFGLAVGAAFAFLIMEIPTIYAYLDQLKVVLR